MASAVQECRVCDICTQPSTIFSLGECDHPICYRCSSRMRGLCGEKHCPVCREDLQQVVFVHKVRPFAELGTIRSLPGDRKLGVRFTDRFLQGKMRALFENRCSRCPDRDAERNFADLKKHVQREHGLFYCDLCEKHLRLFPSERKAYSRPDLARHRRVGDEDDTSHRGHPNCSFCEERFFDDDALLVHLRKHHFWCHFCEKRGGQEYYANYALLREHFRQSHYLCEAGSCVDEKFTSVFDNKLDLQAHCAQAHVAQSKSASRQQRQVDVGILFSAPSVQSSYGPSADRSRSRGGRRDRAGARTRDTEEEELQTAVALSLSEFSQPTEENRADRLTQGRNVVQQATLHQDSFPPLVEDSAGGQSGPLPEPTPSSKPKVEEDPFPALPSTVVPLRAVSTPPGFAAAVGGRHGRPSAAHPSTACASSSSSNGASLTASRVQTTRAAPPGFVPNQSAAVKPASTSPANGPLSLTGKSKAEDFINMVKLCLQFNTEKFQTFRSLSGKFRQGQLQADDYFAAINDLFGPHLPKIFSELVETLPEKHLQQELLRARNDARIHTSAPATTKMKPIKATDVWPQLSNNVSAPNALPVKATDAWPQLGAPESASQWGQQPAKTKPPPVSIPSTRLGTKVVNSMEDFPALSSKAPSRPLLTGSWARRKG